MYVEDAIGASRDLEEALLAKLGTQLANSERRRYRLDLEQVRERIKHLRGLL